MPGILSSHSVPLSAVVITNNVITPQSMTAVSL